jgi:hypothetical protein
MKRNLIASLLGALALLLAAGVGKAAAASPGVQTASQDAGSAQLATSASGATQVDPSNSNISVRVLSPGDDGSVTQSNSATSDASSTNSNSTSQDESQSQPSSGIQTADQAASNYQAAGALSSAYQTGATNQNVDVRVLSPGDNGAVTQSNAVDSTADSTNTNTTDQTGDQTQTGGSGCGCTPAPLTPSGQSTATTPASSGGSGGGVQSSDQSAQNAQLAGAASSADQVDPTNSNLGVRVLSPGDNGSVKQSNKDTSTADATNTNSTSQTSDQDPTGGSSQCGCGGPDAIQVAKQSAGNAQIAAAGSEAIQLGAKNENSPVRVLSHGDDGSVTQSNSVDSTADASNSNTTTQTSDQDQSGSGCGCSSDPIQIAEQSSGSLQGAYALSAAGQSGAKNDNSPVRVGSSGSGGNVDQSNKATSDASADNSNSTTQTADQDQSGSHGCTCGSGLGIQVLGQKAVNGQAALSESTTIQDFGKSECGCSSSGNSNDPVRVWSPGSDGSVDQSNDASSKADSKNTNTTTQDADQSQSGSGLDIQALGQFAGNGQLAEAVSGTLQKKPSNSNGGARVFSPGSGGSVRQSNDASSTGTADNSNSTTQNATQTQSGSSSCGCGGGLKIQALGQKAVNLQAAFGFSETFQIAPKNTNGGTAVWSYSPGGSVHQDNNATSTGTGSNSNGLAQYVTQLQ